MEEIIGKSTLLGMDSLFTINYTNVNICITNVAEMPLIYERRNIMEFDINAILESIDFDAIIAYVTDLLAQIDFQAILDSVIEMVKGLIAA